MLDASGNLRQRRAPQQEQPPPQAPLSLKSLDVYPKIQEDFKVQTQSGATLSIFSGIVMCILFLSELSAYLSVATTDHIVVDTTFGEKLQINFNMTFHSLKCSEVNVDSMDVSGDQQLNIDHTLLKVRLTLDGEPIGDAYAEHMDNAEGVGVAKPGEEEKDPNALPPDYCGSCYGAESKEGACCNTCKEVRDAYLEKGWNPLAVASTAEQCLREKAEKGGKGEGCNISGYMKVNKVAGNFHVALGASQSRDGRHIHSFSFGDTMRYNISHTIHSLSFGDPAVDASITSHGERNGGQPLDGRSRIIDKGTGVQQYFMKIVPTIYKGEAMLERSPELEEHAYAVALAEQKKIEAGLAAEEEVEAKRKRARSRRTGKGAEAKTAEEVVMEAAEKLILEATNAADSARAAEKKAISRARELVAQDSNKGRVVGGEVVKKRRGGFHRMLNMMGLRKVQAGLRSNRYSVTSAFKHVVNEGAYGEQVLPGVFFVYELSPFMVEIETKKVPFMHFLARLFTIVGGVITMTGIVDSLIYRYGGSIGITAKRSTM